MGDTASGALSLNGEAWKNREHTTYTSLLDQYGVPDLFSEQSTKLYQKVRQEREERQQEMSEYVFSGQMQTKAEETDWADLIFSQEIQFSKVMDYGKSTEDYSACLILLEILFVLLFAYILLKRNAGKRKRREAYAAEINMEGGGGEGY